MIWRSLVVAGYAAFALVCTFVLHGGTFFLVFFIVWGGVWLVFGLFWGWADRARQSLLKR
ncbi:MAG TPA: hypothetical protein VN770_06895 [Gaiellaceae bacterium]|nr:hypothetical protein [Gaiellaceae bacterium]